MSSVWGRLLMPIPPPPFQNNRTAPRPPEPEQPAPPKFRDVDILTDTELEFVMKKNLRADQLTDPLIPEYIMRYLGCRNNAEVCREMGIKNHKGEWIKQRPEVYKTLIELNSKKLMKYGYDENEVMARMREIGEFDPIELFNADGTVKTNMNDISPAARRCIKKFEAKNIYEDDANGMPRFRGVLVKVEVWDKLKGLEGMGSEKGVMKKTTVHEHTVSDKMADYLLESGNRADQRRLQVARPVGELTGRVEGENGSTEGNGTDLPGDVPVVEPG